MLSVSLFVALVTTHYYEIESVIEYITFVSDILVLIIREVEIIWTIYTNPYPNKILTFEYDLTT